MAPRDQDLKRQKAQPEKKDTSPSSETDRLLRAEVLPNPAGKESGGRRRFLRKSLVVAGATGTALVFRPRIAVAGSSSLSPILNGPVTEATVLSCFDRGAASAQHTSDVAENKLAASQAASAKAQAGTQSLTPEEEQALNDLISAAQSLRDQWLAAKASWAGLAAADKILLVVGIAITLNRLGDALNVVDRKLSDWDQKLWGIPAGGVIDDAANGMDSANQAVRDLRDDWNDTVPLAGTLVLGPVQAAGEVVEGALRIVGLLFD